MRAGAHWHMGSQPPDHSSLWFPLRIRNQLSQPPQLSFLNPFRGQEAQHQFARRIIEESGQDVIDDVSTCLLSIDHGRVDVRSPAHRVAHLAFVLKYTKNGEDGGIGLTAGKRFGDFRDYRWAYSPQHLHDADLCVRKGW